MLCRLRIPAGWAVIHNWFDDRPFSDNQDENCFFYSDNSLVVAQIRFDQHGGVWSSFPGGLLLDVGWYPNSDPTGAYRLEFSRANLDPTTGATTLLSFGSRDKNLVRQAAELCLELGDRNVPDAELSRALAEALAQAPHPGQELPAVTQKP